jgi:hypothetical protein
LRRQLDAGWFAVLAPVAALVYQSVRENLYRDVSTHPDDALDQILGTVLDRIPTPTGADAAAIIAAHRAVPFPGGEAVSFPPPNAPGKATPSPTAGPSSGFAAPRTLAALALISAFALLAVACLTGCAQTPYYVSGINGTLDTSKDGARISGGGVGVTISPNPYYPLPKSTGLSK